MIAIGFETKVRETHPSQCTVHRAPSREGNQLLNECGIKKSGGRCDSPLERGEGCVNELSIINHILAVQSNET
jgi:hypothetical protein